MDKGHLRQVGAPMEVYRQPANRFVASFIGSPEMNFLPVPDGLSAGRAWLGDHYGSAALQPGAVVGLRPEELMLSGATDASGLNWSGVVQRVERLGAEAYAQIRVGDADVLVRTAADAVLQTHQPIVLTPELSRLRVFDGQSGARLAAQV